jgi:hypothetical protein
MAPQAYYAQFSTLLQRKKTQVFSMPWQHFYAESRIGLVFMGC